MKQHHWAGAPNLVTFKQADQDRRNRLLLDWLSDDQWRATLFEIINQQSGKESGRLEFPSRDATPRECDCKGIKEPLQEPPTEHLPVTLITDRKTINAILQDDGSRWSNRVYAELGGGSFMLALDPKRALAHTVQREAFKDSFRHSRALLIDLSHRACQAAAITALRTADFDLADFAEQTALRFCQKLMGYGFTDYVSLESTLRASYAALVYQVLGRHFSSDPTVIPKAKQAMAVLLKRTSELIDAYATKDTDALKGCTDTDVPPGHERVLEKLGLLRSDLNGEQRAVIAMGSAIGTVGNVQAAICIAVKSLMPRKRWPGDPDQGDVVDSIRWEKARALALSESPLQPTGKFDEWKALLQSALRENPPIPFLPRLKVDENGHAQGEVLLALGGATSHGSGDDPLVWGMPDNGKHWCMGMELAWPLIIETVRHVMALPGLAERLDPEDGSVIGLKKRWGFACESYPLTHRRHSRVAQSSLNVAMRLKAPVRDSADRVRALIRAGAPRIEEALRNARHVHFAWFELIEADTVLVLHTIYDGPFEAYIQHFALKVGDLFDALFQCIEDAPPTPVDKFPNDFIALIQRYNRQPAMGYFFSAYPRSEVARIVGQEMVRP